LLAELVRSEDFGEEEEHNSDEGRGFGVFGYVAFADSYLEANAGDKTMYEKKIGGVFNFFFF
jgi:hypothetical protein